MNPWDERYGKDEYYYGTEPNDFLRDQAAMIPAGADVLCLGEGEGRNAVFLAAAGHRVVALDQSAVGLAKAARLAAARGVALETRVADLAQYRVDADRYGAIVSIWCHLPSALRSRVHPQIVAALAPGGVLIYEAYVPAQIAHGTGGPRDPDLLPTLAELRRDFAALDILHGVECERVVHEGAGHHGMSAVVQLLARKPDRADVESNAV